MRSLCDFSDFFFFNDTATTEIYTLSLHDALPIFLRTLRLRADRRPDEVDDRLRRGAGREDLGDAELLELGDVLVGDRAARSEEHTSELQSRQYLVCRLLLEKKKINNHTY